MLIDLNCLRIVLIALLTVSKLVLADVPEYSKQESEMGAWRSYLSPKDSGAYAIIVFGAQRPERDSPFIPAIHEATSASVESSVRYGKSAQHQASMEATEVEPIIDEHATPWWAMLLTAIGLVFYQIRRPVRPRIGTR